MLTTAGLTLFGWIVAGVGYAWFALTLVVALSSRTVHALGRLLARVLSSGAAGYDQQ